MTFREGAESAGAYVGVYALTGLVLIPVVSGIAGPSEIGDLTGFYLIAHFISAAVLWLPGVLATLLFHRWRGPVPSRRLWVAGMLAAPVVWAGTGLGLGLYAHLVQGMVGSVWAPIVIASGWAVLFSNGILGLMWLLPRSNARP